jgi:ribonuclease
MSSPNGPYKKVAGAAAAVTVAAVAAWFGVDSPARDDARPESTRTTASAPSTAPTSSKRAKDTQEDVCPLSSLPPEAREVVDDILNGGPFAYPDNDGVRFGNYEHVLPQQSRNYYREYTVDTPGVKHRGARRIVVGGGSKTDPDVWFYTDDHYERFCEIPDAEQ